MSLDTLDDALAHFGVKGMRWGIRKRRQSTKADNASAEETTVGVSKKTGGPRKSTPVQVKVIPGKAVKTRGGERQPTAPEAVKSAALKQKAKKSGPQSLTNDEMRFLVDRLGLEERLSKVAPKEKTLGQKFIQDFLPSPVPLMIVKGAKGKLGPQHNPQIAKGLDFAEKLLQGLADNKKSPKKKK